MPRNRGDEAIRVLLADQHPVIRRGLREILGEEEGIALLGEAGSAGELLDLAGRSACEVIVLDLDLPGALGLDLLRRLNEERPEAKLLVFSGQREEDYAVRCLRAGADGYLSKRSEPGRIAEVIRRLAAGERYLSPPLAERLLAAADLAEALPHETLSRREYQILHLVASGKSLTEIGEELDLSVKTISTYRSRLLKKMGLKNNSELTRYALEHKLLG